MGCCDRWIVLLDGIIVRGKRKHGVTIKRIAEHMGVTPQGLLAKRRRGAYTMRDFGHLVRDLQMTDAEILEVIRSI